MQMWICFWYAQLRFWLAFKVHLDPACFFLVLKCHSALLFYGVCNVELSDVAVVRLLPMYLFAVLLC